jgi:hypothetical protein
MADRYWVGGTATWNSTAGSKWSTTSGGSGGASVPTSADDVFFDASSGAGTVTASNVVCANLNFTGFTGTFAGSGTLSVHGSLTVAAGQTWTHTGTTTFLGTSGASLTSNGKTLGSITCSNTTGVIVVGDLVLNTNASLTITDGLFQFGNLTTRNIFITGNNTKTLSTTGSITLTGGDLSDTSTSGTTLSTSTADLIITTSTVAGQTDIIGDWEFDNVTITGGSTATAPHYDRLYISGVVTVNGDLTATGTALRPVTFFGIQGTTEVNVTGTVSLTDVILHHINCGGTWSGTRVGDAGGNTGDITFDSARDLYWIGNGGSWQDNNKWSLTSGGSSATTYPLPQDTCHFDANSFSSASQTVTLNNFWICSMDWTGVTNSPSLTRGSTYFCGSSYIMNQTVTGSSSGLFYFSTPVGGTMTITSNNFDWSSFIAFQFVEIGNGQYNADVIGNYVFTDDFLSNDSFYGEGGINITIESGATVTVDAFFLYKSNIGSSNIHIDGNLKIGNNYDFYLNTDFYAAAQKITTSGAGQITFTHSYPFLRCAGAVSIEPEIVMDGEFGVSTNEMLIDEACTFRKITKTIEREGGGDTFNLIIQSDNIVIDELTFYGSSSLYTTPVLTPREVTVLAADIRRANVFSFNSTYTITARNSVDGGRNTNVVFIDVPTNMTVSTPSLTNKTTSLSSIINLDTNPSSLTNL